MAYKHWIKIFCFKPPEKQFNTIIFWFKILNYLMIAVNLLVIFFSWTIGLLVKSDSPHYDNFIMLCGSLGNPYNYKSS